MNEFIKQTLITAPRENLLIITMSCLVYLNITDELKCSMKFDHNEFRLLINKYTLLFVYAEILITDSFNKATFFYLVF